MLRTRADPLWQTQSTLERVLTWCSALSCFAGKSTQREGSSHSAATPRSLRAEAIAPALRFHAGAARPITIRVIFGGKDDGEIGMLGVDSGYVDDRNQPLVTPANAVRSRQGHFRKTTYCASPDRVLGGGVVAAHPADRDKCNLPAPTRNVRRED